MKGKVNTVKILMITIVAMVLLSSCGTGYCVQSEWATPLSKQYSKNNR